MSTRAPLSLSRLDSLDQHAEFITPGGWQGRVLSDRPTGQGGVKVELPSQTPSVRTLRGALLVRPVPPRGE